MLKIITVLLLSSYACLSKASQKPVIVLDLDNTVLHNHLVNTQATDSSIYNFFPDQTTVTYTYNYLKKTEKVHNTIPAYTIAFIRYLRANFSVHFYSAGTEERNKAAINELWNKSSDFDSKTSTPHLLVVKSRKDLVNKKKDLNVILNALSEPRPSLDNTILIDDNPIYIANGQENNFFQISGASPGNFLFAYKHFFTLIDEFKKQNEKKEETTLEQLLEINTNDNFGAQILSHYKLLYVTYYLDLALNKYKEEGKNISHSIPRPGTSFPIELIEANLKMYRKGLEILKQYTKEQEPKIHEIENTLFNNERIVNFKKLNEEEDFETCLRSLASELFYIEHSHISDNLNNLNIAIKQTKNLFQDIKTIKNQDSSLLKNQELLSSLEEDHLTNSEGIKSFKETGLRKKYDKIKLYQLQKESKNNHNGLMAARNKFNTLKAVLKYTRISLKTKIALDKLNDLLNSTN